MPKRIGKYKNTFRLTMKKQQNKTNTRIARDTNATKTLNYVRNEFLFTLNFGFNKNYYACRLNEFAQLKMHDFRSFYRLILFSSSFLGFQPFIFFANLIKATPQSLFIRTETCRNLFHCLAHIHATTASAHYVTVIISKNKWPQNSLKPCVSKF